MYYIYSDGACSGNKVNEGIGGYGAVIVGPNKDDIETVSGGQKDTTNNRMEIYSAISGLKKLSNMLDHKTDDISCSVYSDSKYLVDSWNDYLFGWIDNGWRRSNNRKVLNIDLWKYLYVLTCNFKRVKFLWVRGHDGNKYNEMADKLATKGIVHLKRKMKS